MHFLRPVLQTFYHGEPIKVHVNINNESNKNVKNIILSGERKAEHIHDHVTHYFEHENRKIVEHKMK